jgi:hypothetical protein
LSRMLQSLLEAGFILQNRELLGVLATHVTAKSVRLDGVRSRAVSSESELSSRALDLDRARPLTSLASDRRTMNDRACQVTE